MIVAVWMSDIVFKFAGSIDFGAEDDSKSVRGSRRFELHQTVENK